MIPGPVKNNIMSQVTELYMIYFIKLDRISKLDKLIKRTINLLVILNKHK